MARIRKDLVGSVLVADPTTGEPLALTAGTKVPEGVHVGDHVLEPGSSPEPTGSPKTPAEDTAAATAAAAKAVEKAAKKAAKAQKAEQEQGTPPVPANALVPPPMNGAGSGAPAWRDYALAATKAAGLEIEIPEDSRRGDIVDALKSANIPVE